MRVLSSVRTSACLIGQSVGQQQRRRCARENVEAGERLGPLGSEEYMSHEDNGLAAFLTRFY